jgi:hypothetical protein
VVDVGVVVYTGQIGQPDEVTVLLSKKYMRCCQMRLWLLFFVFLANAAVEVVSLGYCAQCNTNITAVFIFHVWRGDEEEEKRRMSKVKKKNVVLNYMGTMAR